ncbi:MAG: tetratricopeptide repeat protein [Clostridia bacterium]|nr:tetratricopeptide repeat protein [Clostridia bacterium]
MLDPFDYKEPSCPLSGGREFYYPSPDDPAGTVPVRRIIERFDSYNDKNDGEGALAFLSKWIAEAKELRDLSGELSLQNELMGCLRKLGRKDEALAAAERALELISLAKTEGTVSAATVYLNAATVYKSCERPEDALEYYEAADRIYRAKLDANDKLIAGLCNNSALALCDIGRFDEAESLFVEAAAIMSLYDDGGCDEASTYVNMAHMYEVWRKDGKEEASCCLDTAWQILDSDKTERNSYYAFTASKCAPSYAHFGQNERARILEERSKMIYEGN